jgi:hypothetical protein
MTKPLLRHHKIHDPTNNMVMLFTVDNVPKEEVKCVTITVFHRDLAVHGCSEAWEQVAYRVVHSETCFLDIPPAGINMDKEDARHLWRYLTGSTKKCVPCWKCMDGLSNDGLVRLGMACWTEY